MKKGRPRIDLTGKRYGRLVVIGFAESVGKNNASVFWCRCDCGSVKKICSGNLGGNVLSCGCLRRENLGIYKQGTIHGMSGTNTYSSWKIMIQRCSNISNNPRFKNYGRVCER